MRKNLNLLRLCSTTPVWQAWTRMRKEACEHALVYNLGNLVGVIKKSGLDLIVGLSGSETEHISSVMEDSVFIASAAFTFEQILEQMLDLKKDTVVLLDKHNEPLDIYSIFDIVQMTQKKVSI